MRKTYNKLVRDKFKTIYEYDIKNKISMTGYEARYISKKDVLDLLKDKLKEEMSEVMETYDKEDKALLKEELADMLEVIDAIAYHNGMSLQEVFEAKETKKEKKGGFEDGFYLESIDYID